MKYDIDEIVRSCFDMNDLYHYPELRHSIVYLLNPTIDKINNTRNLLEKTNLPWEVKHHIEIRLEMIEDIILLP
jgi:hypothetical protein